ncbi:MAG: P pilus assembly/Cpx signaling pathway, periplasmic inhibitor/zinc-resistance associated protein [Nostoc sp.]|uniref:Spy/CpxP family protein refolding chaperone n=1 Tax=Nostoc sp. TaxID=1180 RepID=UPI002FF440E8
MKLKALSLVAGAIALTLTATSFAVDAQTASPSPVLLAQTPHRGPWKDLGLTDTQKTQIQAIKRDSRTKMEAVLTPEQKAKLEAAKQARRAEWQARKAQGQTGQRQPGQHHDRGKGGFADLNLSEIQKTEIRQIRQSEKQQIQAVYTPEQRQKLEQFRQNRQQSNPG